MGLYGSPELETPKVKSIIKYNSNEINIFYTVDKEEYISGNIEFLIRYYGKKRILIANVCCLLIFIIGMILLKCKIQIIVMASLILFIMYPTIIKLLWKQEINKKANKSIFPSERILILKENIIQRSCDNIEISIKRQDIERAEVIKEYIYINTIQKKADFIVPLFIFKNETDKGKFLDYFNLK